jgi:hypothetical protein
MRHIRFKLVAIFYAWIFLPIVDVLLRVVSVISRRQFICIGRLRISGPPDFIDLCKASVERLSLLDPKIHRCLTIEQRLWVSYTPWQGRRSGPPWILSVNKAYTKWQTDGVITTLVHMFFHMASLPDGIFTGEEQGAARMTNRRVVFGQTKAWLEEHAFPKALVKCFIE